MSFVVVNIAKELMVEKSKQIPGALGKFKQTFRKQSSGEESFSESYSNRGAEVRRSLTMSGPLVRRRLSKRSSLTEEGLLSPTRRATFYEHEDVTRPVCHPADFAPLELQGKKMNQVLKLLKAVSQYMYRVRESCIGSTSHFSKCSLHFHSKHFLVSRSVHADAIHPA